MAGACRCRVSGVGAGVLPGAPGADRPLGQLACHARLAACEPLAVHPGALATLGDLLFGFTLSWWAGTLYWGWLRAEPMLHLPVEAIPLPIAATALLFGYFRNGSLFFLGSLLGTCLTDFYCMSIGLMPWWERMMNAENNASALATVLPAALAQMHTPVGGVLAAGVALVLLAITLWAMRSKELPMWTFAGAVFSTLLVDGLFWLSANLYLVGS